MTHDEYLPAHRFERVLDAPFGTFTNGYHRDHRSHADHHPQCGQERSELVPQQGTARHTADRQCVHGRTSGSAVDNVDSGAETGAEAASAARLVTAGPGRAIRGCWRSSETICPSLIVITRSAHRPMSGSWVTRIMVMPERPSS